MRSPKQNITVPDLADLKEQLGSVIATLTLLVDAAGEREAASFTLKRFLARNSLSESQYHKLRREGRGPRIMKTGSVGVRISRQAELDWIAAREIEAETVAKEIAPTEKTGDREGRPTNCSEPVPAGRKAQSECLITPTAT